MLTELLRPPARLSTMAHGEECQALSVAAFSTSLETYWKSIKMSSPLLRLSITESHSVLPRLLISLLVLRPTDTTLDGPIKFMVKLSPFQVPTTATLRRSQLVLLLRSSPGTSQLSCKPGNSVLHLPLDAQSL